ncbi:MAG: hypothetical protein H7Y04_14375 [Verrucomicrobia bacterium]|nr:hypothetical protein [Cytophagales bacterium]
MKTPFQFVVFFWLLTVKSSSIFAQTETFDLVTFKSPSGNWKRQQTNDYVMFQEIKGVAYCQLAVYKSRRGTSDALQNFTDEYKALAVNMVGAEANPKTTQEVMPEGWTSISGAGRFSKNGVSGVSMLVVCTHGNTLVTLLSTTNNEQYFPTIQTFFDAINLKIPANKQQVLPDAKVKPATKNPPSSNNSTKYTFNASGLPGVWAGLGNRLAAKSYGTVIQKDINYLIIYNDGKLREGSVFPRQGLDNFNREENRTRDAGYWADYSLPEKLARFEYRKIKMEFAAGKLVYNDAEYTKLPHVDGLKLNATYTADPKGAEYLGYEPVITFYANGKFEDKGALNRADDLEAMFKKFGSGTYQIKNFTIYLNYSDSRGTAKLSFISMDGLNNPRSIFITEKNLQRK